MAKRTNDTKSVVDGNVESGPKIIDGDNDGNSGHVVDNINGVELVEPQTGTDNSGIDNGQHVKRGRGRPAGSGNNKTGSGNSRAGTNKTGNGKASQISVIGIEKLLFSIHEMVSAHTGIDEIKLDRTESNQLAQGLADVASHYQVEVDPKVLAWIGLISVSAHIYGPRFAMWKMNKKLKTNKDDNIVNNISGIYQSMPPIPPIPDKFNH